MDIVDAVGYRANVGIMIANANNQLLWARLKRKKFWQFPQGGIDQGEEPEQSLFRELEEEVGLLPQHVELLGRTHDWIYYEIPFHWRKSDQNYRGQKQIWFLLKFIGQDSDINLSTSDHPEFDQWCWRDYWTDTSDVIAFKRRSYQLALQELAPLLGLEKR